MPETQAPPTPAKAAPNVDKMLDAAVEKTVPVGATETPGAPPPPQPSWRDAILDGDDVPETFRGKKVSDLIASQVNAQQAVSRYQSERDRTAAELHRAQTELTARQAAERSVREMLQPKEVPQEDPRYAQLNDLMFTDPAAYRQLYDSIQEERTQKMLAAERVRIKSELTQESATQRGQEIGRWAFNEARNSLHGRGVRDEMFTPARIAALYSAITLKSTPDSPNEYYDAGGPQSPAVIFKAWGDLFGFPQTQAAPPPPVVVAPPAINTPPGGGRPAAPVVPPPADAGKPMSRELSAVFESFAEEMGKPKDHLIRRARGAA